MAKLKFYDFEKSGHAHRARLMASLLGLEFDSQYVDLVGGEHKGEKFLSLNAMGQVPVLDDNGVIISDSTAILVYLAKKYGDETWMPTNPIDAANVQRFLSIASGEVFRGPCCARLFTVFGFPFDLDAAKAVAKNLFEMLEKHLAGRDWLATDHRTIADIACYSYIAHAPEGDIDLKPYPNIRKWLGNVEGLQGFVAMPATKIHYAA